MNTTEKGNKLEDQLYDYLRIQLARGNSVFDVYPANLCEVHKKKKYYCRDREGDVEFDVVIEIRREGRSEPHLRVIFECKNHKNPVQERDIRDFSDKIRGIYAHGTKGLVVSSSRLQSGAEKVARNRGLGIVKFDENGIDIVVDRTGGTWTESNFVKSQLVDGTEQSKSLKFSAYSDGKFFGSIDQLLRSFTPEFAVEGGTAVGSPSNYVPFIPDNKIREIAEKSLNLLGYVRGAVDLQRLCEELEVQLTFSETLAQDFDGHLILGTANFTERMIEINLHGNKHRERFTIAHEIGHFCLRHDRYLHSESVIEHDLLVDAKSDGTLNYERLENQANIFASELLLPVGDFRISVEALRIHFGIVDRGFGYIFVDDQPCNYTPYNEMMFALSNHFEVSKQAIEIRLNRMGLVTDKRKNSQFSRLRFEIRS